MKTTQAALAALFLFSIGGETAIAGPPGGSLDPADVPQFVSPLVIPPVMPLKGFKWDPAIRRFVPYYEIEVVQFQQQILPGTDGFGHPTGLGPTTVWSYAAVGRPETRNYPAFTIESLKDLPTRVRWVNNLKDADGNFLTHLLPVDQTLHWANPGQLPCMPHPPDTEPMAHTDCRPADPPQTAYDGPVPIVTHLHGAHVQPDSDGFPEAWYLPDAENIPSGYATQGARFDQIPDVPATAGAAVFQYRNDQPAATLWYHDHTLGMTRANVYAGPAGFYLLRDIGNIPLRLPGPAPLPGTDPNGNPLVRRLTHEIPIVIQDRSFNADGSLFYPDNRDFFEVGPDGNPLSPGTLASLGILFTPQDGSDVPPIWNPEFFGNTMVVNGKTWPTLSVERRKYRFRFLNGSNSRFLILRYENEALTFHQIGADQGFLPAPVPLTRLLIGPAERADVIVDFAGLPAGTRILLENIGPDEPFGGGVACVPPTTDPGVDCDFLPSDPETTGLVMAFDVVKRTSPDVSRIPASLPVGNRDLFPTVTRQLSLNEMESATQQACFDAYGNYILTPGTANDADACEGAGGTPAPFGPTMAALGTLTAGAGNPLAWGDGITENPDLDATEMWEIFNFTADAHPIHLHQVRFRVLERQALETDDEGMSAQPAVLVPGTETPAEPWEAGFKDTVISYPGQVTRIAATFDIPGLYVWHCHILEHEDNEMMRPYCVGTPGADGPADLCGTLPILP
jgi:FtsP/CotA-like multicopper oxidase with cupredoxin domain